MHKARYSKISMRRLGEAVHALASVRVLERKEAIAVPSMPMCLGVGMRSAVSTDVEGLTGLWSLHIIRGC